MTNPATVFERDAGGRSGEIEGRALGTGVSVIVVDYQEVGQGPALHTHPYAETFIVLEGTALFDVDGEQVSVTAGSALVAPAGAPHRFENLGPGRLLQVDIHSADTFDTDWLDS